MVNNNPGHRLYGETFTQEAPKPNAAAYEVLLRHLKKQDSFEGESHEILNDIYKALWDSEAEADAALVTMEQKGLVSREDTLMLIVLLAISRTLGPDLDFLRRAIITGNFRASTVNEMIKASGLDDSLVSYLQTITDKFTAEIKE
ncbi:MAG: hypothetical protein P4L74_07330 [Candidatus Doudnabacteria bacterium]|nr:hypothetical protein [Candidatus Doudnabacteria bacterium]